MPLGAAPPDASATRLGRAAETAAGATTYPSKRDAWLVLLLWVAAAGMAFAAWDVWRSAEPLGFRFGFGGFMLAAAAFVLWVLYGTAYTLTPSDLVIRSGPFRWTVPLGSIAEIHPTRNPLSSPACSLDRLHVRYRDRRRVLISPADKGAFLRDLAARTPGLRLEGDRAVREGS